MTDPTPTPVPTTNAAAQDVVGIVQDLERQGETMAETAIIAAVPWMGTVVLKQIWEAVFDWLFNLIAKPLANYSGRVVISIEEYMALKKVAAASAALTQAKQSGDANALSQASTAVDQAVAPVIQYIGATHTS